MDLVKRASDLLEQRGCKRVYATLKIDIRSGARGRLQSKTRSIEARIGEVSTGRRSDSDISEHGGGGER